MTKGGFFFKSLGLAALFVVLAIVVVNYRSYISFIGADYPFFDKLKILFLIFWGSFNSTSPKDVSMLLLTAVLFGVNMELVLRKITFLKGQKSVGLTFGVGIVSVAATGCASCGLSLVSLVGIAGVLTLLPFKGFELYLLSIGILMVSIIYNLNSIYKTCKL